MFAFTAAWRFAEGDPGGTQMFRQKLPVGVSLLFGHSHLPRLASCSLQALQKGHLLPEATHPHQGELLLVTLCLGKTAPGDREAGRRHVAGPRGQRQLLVGMWSHGY